MLSNTRPFGLPWPATAVLSFFIATFGFAAVGWAQVALPGRWVTFVVTSPQELRVLPPPDETTTDVELRELKGHAARRNEMVNDRIAWWTTGGAPYRWNRIAAAELLARGVGTPFSARHIALVNVAIHDAVVSALASKDIYKRTRPSVRDTDLVTARAVPETTSYPSDSAAAAAAASDVLAYLFPDKADEFWRMAEEAVQMEVQSGLSYPSDVSAGLGLGHEVGARVIARAKSDGFDSKWTGSVPKGPGLWNGTDPVAPLAGTWKTWVLPAGILCVHRLRLPSIHRRCVQRWRSSRPSNGRRPCSVQHGSGSMVPEAPAAGISGMSRRLEKSWSMASPASLKKPYVHSP